ncbi:unnamed protein product [Cercopithifilaria johnstoni]|uniref:Uncharacterized protein n=1 Tax=Cercopithifilaria johnstoni TaxID=2874296 RepID=A0A8J2M3Z5_9BILA|nr:unnamed protein product [Cercopithifilaria johnstoni]
MIIINGTINPLRDLYYQMGERNFVDFKAAHSQISKTLPNPELWEISSTVNVLFMPNNGELPEKQLHLLRHPKTGNATLYAIGSDRVEELLKFDDGFRSVLLGNNVVSNGSLVLLVPVNPALLLLPYLQKYAKDDYVSLKDILVDDCFPSIKLLENVKAVKTSLKHACHCKESNFDSTVCGMLEENLPDDILRLVEICFIPEGNEDSPPNKRQKNQDSESRERRDELTGSDIRPLQETDSLAAEVPIKYTRLRNGKIFT